MTGFVDNDIMQTINEFCLLDDAFMTKVFENNIPCTELVLRIILEDDKIKVKQVRTQSKLKNLQGHDLILDILAEKEDGTQFNIEIQNESSGATAKRARYHMSVLDANSLPSGAGYKSLPDSYVIFITRHDVLKGKMPLYHVERTIRENGRLFGDGSQIIYVNNQIQGDTPLGLLMRDFACKEPEKMHYKELAERVEFLKRTKEGHDTMGDAMERLVKKYEKKAVEERSREIAMRMLEDGMEVALVARYAQLSEDEVRKLAGMRSA